MGPDIIINHRGPVRKKSWEKAPGKLNYYGKLPERTINYEVLKEENSTSLCFRIYIHKSRENAPTKKVWRSPNH